MVRGLYRGCALNYEPRQHVQPVICLLHALRTKRMKLKEFTKSLKFFAVVLGPWRSFVEGLLEMHSCAQASRSRLYQTPRRFGMQWWKRDEKT